MSDFERWDTRYRVPEYIFGEAPNFFLASCEKLLPRCGVALAIADGEGRNGVWLAEHGLDVLSIDFSPSAQEKAKALARKRQIPVRFQLADIHNWTFPDNGFDVICEIFTQFSSPSQRRLKWQGYRRALRPGGLLIVLGYAPKQLEYGTGGPKELENLYTAELLKSAFGDFTGFAITEEERELHEGTSHGGMSAVIGMTGRKPAA